VLLCLASALLRAFIWVCCRALEHLGACLLWGFPLSLLRCDDVSGALRVPMVQLLPWCSWGDVGDVFAADLGAEILAVWMLVVFFLQLLVNQWPLFAAAWFGEVGLVWPPSCQLSRIWEC
jgi:hypothetical protein